MLEICQAVRLHKPIVLLELRSPGKEFSFADAFDLLSDLKGNLRTRNPAALVELQGNTEQPLSELQEMVKGALEAARAKGVPHLNLNG